MQGMVGVPRSGVRAVGISLLGRTATATLLLLLTPILLMAQGGGRHAYTFLDLPVSPRLAALGGKAPSLINSPSPSLGMHNPAAALPDIHGMAEVGFTLYYASIKYNHAAYFHHVPSIGMLGLSLRQVWYGRLTRRDALGAAQGHFTAYDQALSLHYSQTLWRGLRIGATLTPILSRIERYTSVALGMDVGLLYHSDDRFVSAGLLCRGVGASLRGYTRNAVESTPFEVLAGASLGLEYAPVRFIVTLQHLENWKSRFSSEDTRNPLEGNGRWEEESESNWQALYRELLAHPIIGMELYPSRYFYLQVAYNHKRRSEMAVEARPYLVGFSWGVGIQIKRFSFGFARAVYHVHGATNHISISYQFGRPPSAPHTEAPSDLLDVIQQPHDSAEP